MSDSELMPIPITKVQMNLVDGTGPTRAIGSVTFGGSFVVHGVSAVSGANGPFVAMPQRKDGDEYRDMAHPITGELRARLGSAVLEAYERLRERERGRGT